MKNFLRRKGGFRCIGGDGCSSLKERTVCWGRNFKLMEKSEKLISSGLGLKLGLGETLGAANAGVAGSLRSGKEQARGSYGKTNKWGE